jgi:hypothetical protein
MIKSILFIGIFLLAVGSVYAALYFRRQRIKRRREPHFDIPDFLSKAPKASDNPSGSLQSDWTEVYGLRRGPRKDGGPSV